MPRSPVCVDANIAVMIVAPEHQRPKALALWDSLLREEREIVAPHLFAYEIASALWRKAARGLLTIEEGRRALQRALDLGVTYWDTSSISERAFDLAAHFNRPAAYDAHYLALAEYLSCPFWTADERLYNAVRAGFPFIRWLGDFHTPSSQVAGTPGEEK